MENMQLKPLPASKSDIGIILRENFLYIDKTRFVYDMIKESGSYFLSRPRRFGKSMLLSTFERVFLGDKELFKDQWIYNSPWEWNKYPVIRLDFNIAPDTNLEEQIKHRLKRIAMHYEVYDAAEFASLPYDSAFYDLIASLYELSDNKGVVVLIDEYDKPILDVLDDVPQAEAKREILKGFYTVMKGLDDKLRFVFLTGVTRFSKVGIFSGLNNLRDISMTDEHATICGITQGELEKYCQPYIQILADKNNMTYDKCIEHIRVWYNGFRFAIGGESVYNPYSTVNVLISQRFGNYWFTSGNASSVIKFMQNKQDVSILELDEHIATMSEFDTFDIKELNSIAFLFQAGYLTIKDYVGDAESGYFILSYPNKEVNKSFKENVFSTWSKSSTQTDNALIKISIALNNNDIDEVMTQLKRIFVNLDYDIRLSYEQHYQSVFYLIFQLLGFHINTEYKTAQGRIDAIIQTKAGNVYIFEFKLNESAASALQQIKDTKYADRFTIDKKPTYIIGANFDTELRNIGDYVVEKITS